MWPLVIVNPYEVLEALLLLQEIEGWGLGGFLFQGQMHTLVAAVLLGVAWFDALYPDTEAQPPNRKPGQAEKGIGRSEGDTVIGTDGLWNPELFENTLKDGESELGTGRCESFAGEQVTGAVIGNGERIAVLPVTEQELAFVVSAPQAVGLVCSGQDGALGFVPSAFSAFDESVAVEDGVDGADRRGFKHGV